MTKKGLCGKINPKKKEGFMYNCSIRLQVLPGVPEEELFGAVDRVIEYIRFTGVRYVVCPFDAAREGDFDQLMDILTHCQQIVVENGANGVFSNVKIAYNPGGRVSTIEEKTAKCKV